MRATPKGVAYFFVRIREKRADFTPHCTALPGCWAFSFSVSYHHKKSNFRDQPAFHLMSLEESRKKKSQKKDF